MKPAHRRRFLVLAAGGVALPVLPRAARAQSYPARPVRILVGFPPGSAPDIVARLLGQDLSARLGQPFVIENRPGASSNIATEAVVNAPADGYTLLVVSLANVFNATLYDRLNFDFLRDIAPVASFDRQPFVLETHPSVPARTVPEFIAYAKANPGKINMASAGAGSAPHVLGELFKTMAGVDLLHVPYRGNPLPELLSGQVQVFFGPIQSGIEYIRTGKLRALAVTTAARSEPPGRSDAQRFRAGLRGERVAWPGCTEEYAARHRRTAQPGNQCESREPRDESEIRRYGRHAVYQSAG
jgi:tripartite-type tricarboxylate transporter receptor subunit TctC